MSIAEAEIRWFEAYRARDLEMGALHSRIAELEGAQDKLAANLRQLVAYGRWQISPESVSHHPTLPSAVAQAASVLKELGLDKPDYQSLQARTALKAHP